MAAKLEARDMVFIVDDDESLREALARLFRSVGLGVQAYATPPEFLASKLPDVPSCLVLDIRLPGMSGLDFQAELGNANINIPIIFITGHGDIPMTVKAMKAGAVEFLTKPLREQDLLDAVRTALVRDRARREQQSTEADLRSRFETLTTREKEVMAFVAAGLMNKQIAAKMELSEVTVKFHRGHIMQKMAARSLADLVRMAESLGIHQKNLHDFEILHLSIVGLFPSIEASYLWIAPNPSFARCIMATTKSHKAPMISIVDDDKSFREATKRLMKSMGYGVSLFVSAEDFLQSERVADSSCLIVDMHMPGLSGTELQQHLIAKGNRTPIIFVSALANEKTKAMALEAGAIGFLDKPLREQSLIDFVDAALKRPSDAPIKGS